VELAYGPAAFVESIRTVVGIEFVVIAYGYIPMNFHFQEHRGTWGKMIAAAVLDVAVHYRPLVQSHML
jgi:hypothetical protein